MIRTRIRPLAERVGRRARVVSPLGWGLIVVAITSLSLVAAFGWAELLAVGSVCIIALLAAIPFIVGRPRYRVRVELAAPRVVVGEPAVGRLVVGNAAPRRSPRTRIELPVGAARAEFRMPRLAPGDEHDELFTIPTHRRAVLVLGPVTSVRSDPLGLVRREVRWTDPTELFVHPKVVRLASDMTGILRDLEGLPTRDLADDDVSFHALREYVPGDDLRHVHWRSTARAGALMIRQFEQTRRSHLAIVLSTTPHDYATAEEFELAVSVAGSIGLQAIAEGKALSVFTSTGVVPADTANTFLDGLSGVQIHASALTLPALGATLPRRVPNASVFAFITGSASAPADLRSASLRVPATARSFGVRAVEGGELSRRALGDLVAVDVPELSALRSAMRAVSE